MMHGYVGISEHHLEYHTICETCWGGGLFKGREAILKVLQKKWDREGKNHADSGTYVQYDIYMYMPYICKEMSCCLVFFYWYTETGVRKHFIV